MLSLDRTNTSLVGRWWWTVDRPTLIALTLLMLAGALLMMAGSPPVAERLDLNSFYFVKRQWMFLSLAFCIMISISLMPTRWVIKLAFGGLAISVVLMVAVLFTGEAVKGATRWFSLFGMTIQPSEFMKPLFAVTAAWLFAQSCTRQGQTWWQLAVGLYVLVSALLLLQPDVGMWVTTSVIWGAQFFLAGLPLLLVGGLVVLGVIGGVGAYIFLPHVTARVNSFIDPDAPGNFQVRKSLEALQNGGLLGVGPGEGVVKRGLPDAHTDFIFSAMGEEFGYVACLAVLCLLGFILARGFWQVKREKDLFVILAVAGIMVQFGVQSLINIGVSLHLLPTKGMTLPFISYGGSSTIAFAIGMGIMLALTRRRFGTRRETSLVDPLLYAPR